MVAHKVAACGFMTPALTPGCRRLDGVCSVGRAHVGQDGERRRVARAQEGHARQAARLKDALQLPRQPLPVAHPFNCSLSRFRKDSERAFGLETCCSTCST